MVQCATVKGPDRERSCPKLKADRPGSDIEESMGNSALRPMCASVRPSERIGEFEVREADHAQCNQTGTRTPFIDRRSFYRSPAAAAGGLFAALYWIVRSVSRRGAGAAGKTYPPDAFVQYPPDGM